MPLKPLTTLLLLAACTHAAAADLYASINRLRSGSSACAGATALPPLNIKPELERAAAAIANGGGLDNSIAQSGYRATRANTINISGDAGDEQKLALIEQKYCSTLLNPAATDIGIYQDARQWLIVLAAPFAPAVVDNADAAARKVLELINKARATARTCGNKAFKAAGPLKLNNTLSDAARVHAEDMARNNFFSHDGSDGSHPAQRVTRAGYKFRATGENIAAGQTTPDEAVAGWIKSPPHCANLMNPAYTEMGLAYAISAASKLGVYWAQEFGTPR